MPLPGFRTHKHPPHPSNYPVITNIAWIVSGTSVSISWTTDVASTSQVAYGTNQNKDLRSPYDSSLVTGHLVILNNLNPFTVYFFNVQSFHIDALSISVQNAFITIGTGPTSNIVFEDGSGIILTESGNKIILES